MSASIDYCPKADRRKSTHLRRSRWSSKAADAGRKPPVSIGDELSEKRTISNRRRLSHVRLVWSLLLSTSDPSTAMKLCASAAETSLGRGGAEGSCASGRGSSATDLI
jgi:hypothetical protein